jgi:hypothetical protein
MTSPSNTDNSARNHRNNDEYVYVSIRQRQKGNCTKDREEVTEKQQQMRQRETAIEKAKQ